MTWIKECEYDDVTECVLVTLHFECGAPGHQDVTFAVGISEAQELINDLQKAVDQGLNQR